MSSHVIFREIDAADKAPLEAYWARKLPRLQKLLVPYCADLQEIALTVYRHPRNSHKAWYEVRAVIHLPTGGARSRGQRLEGGSSIGPRHGQACPRD